MRAPSPAPGACGTPHGRTRLPRAPGKPASQYLIRSCEPAPRTPPQVVDTTILARRCHRGRPHHHSDYEAENGDIAGMFRDVRGTLYHPHAGHDIPLGTLAVEQYERPNWIFNKVLFIEKEGFFEALKAAQWPERHDCALITGKGYATRAVRDLVDFLGDSDE